MIDFDIKRWDEVKDVAELWWAGKLERPMLHISIRCHNPNRPPPKLQVVTPRTLYDLTVPAADIVDYWDYELSKCRFLADGFPHIWPNFGPGVLATFIGGVAEPMDNTVWFRPASNIDIHDLHFVYNSEAIWLQRIKDIYRTAHERWGGLVQLGMTDLGGILDILSIFRPSGTLLLDFYDHPDEVKRLIWELHNIWWQAFNDLNAVLQPLNPGYTAWAPVFSATPYYMLQCDISYMISPEMFNEFVKPELAASCTKLDHAFYHLDGRGQLPHLDSLLSISELDGIQWVPGTGNSPEDKWPQVYQRIHAAGKFIQVYNPQTLNMLSKWNGRNDNAVLIALNLDENHLGMSNLQRFIDRVAGK